MPGAFNPRSWIRVLSIGGLAALCVILGVTSVASAQSCPIEPAGFQPHVEVTPAPNLIWTPSWTVHVRHMQVHCTFSNELNLPAEPRDLVVTVVEGPSKGKTLPIARALGGVRITLPMPGEYTLRIASARFPDLKAATARVLVVDRARALQIRLRLLPSPRDSDLRQGGSVRLIRGSYQTDWVRALRTGDAWLTTELRLERGPYELDWLRAPLRRRRAPIEITAAGTLDVAFLGGSVELKTDWLPANERYQVEIVPSRGGSVEAALHSWGALIGDDVPPGDAVLRLLRSDRRRAAFDTSRRDGWTEVFREKIRVPSAGELVVHWSMPRLFAGSPPTPGLWTELPCLPGVARGLGAPKQPGALLAKDGAVSVIADRVFTFAAGKWAWTAPPPTMRRGTSATERVDGVGTTLPDAARVAASALRHDAFAWTEGGEFVSFRTPAGLSQEFLPADVSGPCHALGISAISERQLFVVGACGAIDLRDSTAGFIAERGPKQWAASRRYPHALRGVASEGPIVVAVGDRGHVAWRRGNDWSLHRNGVSDLEDVSVLGARVIARTAGGSLLELPADNGKPPRPLPPFFVGRARGRASAHCLLPTGVVALYPADYPDEGEHVLSQAYVVLHEANRARVLAQGDDIVAIACDLAAAVYLRRSPGNGEVRLERSDFGHAGGEGVRRDADHSAAIKQRPGGCGCRVASGERSLEALAAAVLSALVLLRRLCTKRRNRLWFRPHPPA